MIAAIGFIAGGAGVLFSVTGWRPVIVAAAIFSAVVYAFFWDGKLHQLPDQGAVAMLINWGILIAALVF